MRGNQDIGDQVSNNDEDFYTRYASPGPRRPDGEPDGSDDAGSEGATGAAPRPPTEAEAGELTVAHGEPASEADSDETLEVSPDVLGAAVAGQRPREASQHAAPPSERPPAPDAYGWGTPGGGRHGYDARPPQAPTPPTPQAPRRSPTPPEAPLVGPPPVRERGAAGHPPAGPASGPQSVAPESRRSPEPPWAPPPRPERSAGPNSGPIQLPEGPDSPQLGGESPGERRTQAYPPRRAQVNPQRPPLDPRQQGGRAGYPTEYLPREQSLDRGRQTDFSVGSMRAQIREAELVRPHKPEPEKGWRKALRRTTGINLGPSPAEREWKDLERRLKANLRGAYLIAVMQIKGGVSKTTTTVGLGAALARYRDDKVVAIDGNPARGNLAERIDHPSQNTWRSLISDDNLNAYSDFRFHLGKDSTSGLEVLGSDPGDEVIQGWQLTEAWQRLQRQYPVGLIDCGNQMADDVTAAVLQMADAVVVVSTTRLDGAKYAQDTLNWLLAHGYPHLVRSAVMVISNVTKIAADTAVRNLHEDFERVVRAVHTIPYDPHLHEATAIDFDRLKPETRRAFIEAAASLADGFAGAADRDPGSLGRPGPTEWRR